MILSTVLYDEGNGEDNWTSYEINGSPTLTKEPDHLYIEADDPFENEYTEEGRWGTSSVDLSDYTELEFRFDYDTSGEIINHVRVGYTTDVENDGFGIWEDIESFEGTGTDENHTFDISSVTDNLEIGFVAHVEQNEGTANAEIQMWEVTLYK